MAHISGEMLASAPRDVRRKWNDAGMLLQHPAGKIDRGIIRLMVQRCKGRERQLNALCMLHDICLMQVQSFGRSVGRCVCIYTLRASPLKLTHKQGNLSCIVQHTCRTKCKDEAQTKTLFCRRSSPHTLLCRATHTALLPGTLACAWNRRGNLFFRVRVL